VGKRKASSSLMFLDIESNGDKLQVVLNEKSVGDLSSYSLRRGSIIGIEGEPGHTQAGEFSLFAKSLTHLAECDQSLPMTNWDHKKTLKDGEKRFRERHLDLIVNNELKQFFIRRARILSFFRKFLTDRDFLEVETPILNAQAGGALARPFLTRSDVLKQDYELRIAPELFLKQLVIGGFERVFEIGKVFRNEGIDSTHNPEFTSIEFYWAYADYQDLFTLTEELLQGLAMDLFGTMSPEI
jgi:lysyl-tRNA synthetase, class II